MKALKFVRPFETEFYDTAEPAVSGPDDVKIQVAYSGICGDELSFFRKDVDMLAWGPVLFPLTGHEMSGVITQLGPQAKKAGFKEGDRVTGYAWDQCGHCVYCRSGKEQHCLNLRPATSTMAEYTVWHSRQLIRVPGSVPLKEACLCDPIGHSLHGINRSKLKIGDSVLIIGAGANGLIILQLAKMCGAIHITMVEHNEEKRRIARELGAEHCIDPGPGSISAKALNITDNLGYDVVFETSGNADMLSLALKLLARQGTLAFGSVYGLNIVPPISLSELYIKEASLVPFHMAPYMLPKIQSIMPRLTLKPLISKVFPFAEAQSAYEAAETGEYTHIIVKIGDAE